MGSPAQGPSYPSSMADTASVRISWEGVRLTVHSAGDCEVAWVLALIDRVADAATSTPTRSVLVDVTALQVTLTDLDRYNIGMQVARRWRGVPYAMVAAPEVVDPRRFGEMVARNRGVHGQVFTDRAEALRWLDEQHPHFL